MECLGLQLVKKVLVVVGMGFLAHSFLPAILWITTRCSAWLFLWHCQPVSRFWEWFIDSNQSVLNYITSTTMHPCARDVILSRWQKSVASWCMATWVPIVMWYIVWKIVYHNHQPDCWRSNHKHFLAVPKATVKNGGAKHVLVLTDGELDPDILVIYENTIQDNFKETLT